MGIELRIDNATADGKIDRETGAAGKPAGKLGSSGKNPDTARTGAAGTGAAGTGAAGTGAAGKEKEAKVSGLALIKEAKPDEKVQEKPEKKKPKRVRQTKKKEPALPVEQVDALIVSLSGIIAARPGCSHWAISESEAHSVSVPLCNILEKSEVLQQMGENADAVALGVAAISIILPRAMITVAEVKERKKRARTGNKVEVNVKEGKTENAGAGVFERNAEQRQPTAHVSGNVSDLSVLGAVVG